MEKGPIFDIAKVFSMLKGKVVEAEVYENRSESLPVIFRANKLKSAEANLSCGASLRIIADGKTGFASSNDPSDLDSLVNRALKSASFGGKANFTLPSSCKTTEVPRTYYGETLKYNRDHKIKSGEESIGRILEKSPGVNIDLEIETGSAKTFLTNMKGLSLSSEKTWYTYGFSILNVGKDGLLWISKGNSSSKVDIKNKTLEDEALFLLEKAGWISPAGRSPAIILEPSVVSTLVSSFLAGLNGKTVQKGASPLSKKLGEKLVDSRFSLIEDPFINDRPASSPFDDEGVPRSRNALFDKGVPTMFISDLETAGITKSKPTGNGERSYASLPSPGYSNLVIPGGPKKTSQIIKETKNGLWIHSVLGSGQSNMLAGDFSLNAHLAYKIENGEITGRVKDTMISGNVYDIFKTIIDISSDQDNTGSKFFPAIAFEGIKVAG